MTASPLVRGVTLAAGLALASGISIASAQNAPSPSSAPHMNSSSKIAAHIDHLKAELEITPAEEPKWTALASVMRDNAVTMEKVYKKRSQHAASMNAVEILKSYREFTRTHLKGLNKLIPPFTRLYKVLSAHQKTTINALFQNRVSTAAARKTP